MMDNIYGNYATTDPLVKDRVSGMSYKELAIKYNKTEKAIDAYLRRRAVAHPKLKSIDINDVMSKYGGGMTIEDVARVLGVEYRFINLALRNAGIKPNWHRKKAAVRSGRQVDEPDICSRYKNGESMASIAKEYGFVGDSSIRQILNKNNVKIRRTGIHQLKAVDKFKAKEKLDDVEHIKALYASGKSAAEIGSIIGVSQHPVLDILNKSGVKMRCVHQYSSYKIGEYHKEIISWLDTNNIKHTSCWPLNTRWNGKDKYWEIDEYLPDYKLFIEVNGEHWHGINTHSKRYSNVRTKMWSDLYKYMAIDRDYPDHKIVYLTNKDTNISKLSSILRLSAKNRKCSKSTLTFKTEQYSMGIRTFLNKTHYLGFTRGRYYCAYEGARLVGVAIVAKPTRQTIKASDGTNCAELVRLATDRSSANMPTQLLAFVQAEEKKIGTNAIVSFADQTPWRKEQHFGTIYKAANWKFVGKTGWNYCYCDKAGNVLHKKTVYNRAKKNGLKEKEYATQNNLYKLPEWPKLKYETVLNK